MRKQLICLALTVALALGGAAFAETQQQWDAGSDWRTNVTLNVYHAHTDAANGIAPVEVLPAGVFLRVNAEKDGWLYVDYMLDGRMGTGAVQLQLVTCLNPTPSPVPPTPTPTAIPTATPTPMPTPTPTPQPTMKPEDRQAVTLRSTGETGLVVSLGTYTCTLLINDVETEVPASDVVFNAAQSANHQIALVYAPRTGKVTMRGSASNKGKNLGQLEAGTVVGVLEEGSNFSKCLVNNKAVYILNSCLTYDNAVQAEEPGHGHITLPKGDSGTVRVRTQGSQNSAEITKWPTGVNVLIMGTDGDWYELEYNGIRGYVLGDYVTLGYAD